MAPISLAANDITTLLPSNEEDFNNGVLPTTRAALENTLPAREKPLLVDTPTRSLFASLMQSHQLWGIVLRRAVSNNRSMPPWDSNSEYSAIKKKLSDWESRLPAEHLWSRTLLRDFKAQNLDLVRHPFCRIFSNHFDVRLPTKLTSCLGVYSRDYGHAPV